MKIQNVIRMNTIFIGATALLFCTTSVQSQEIENTAWHDGASVSKNPQADAAPAPPAKNVIPPASDTLSMSPSASVSGPVAKHDPSISQWAPVQMWLFVSLLGSIVIVAITALAEAKRTKRKLAVRPRAVNPKPTLP
jgi:hypothetical protein